MRGVPAERRGDQPRTESLDASEATTVVRPARPRRIASQAPETLVAHFPADGDAPARLRERTVFGRVGCEFVDDQSKHLREWCAGIDGRSIDVGARDKRRQLAFDQLAQRSATGLAGGDEFLRPGDGLQAADDRLARAFYVGVAKRRVLRTMDCTTASMFFRPMLQFAHEQHLPRLGVATLSDVAGDGMQSDRLAERIEDQLWN